MVAGPASVAPPIVAREIFGDGLSGAIRYAEMLAGAGVKRGLIGPREIERLWPRHLLNCAVVAELIPTSSRLVDVGSGAGLPGIPLALARPDIQVDLVDSLQRRVVFLHEVCDDLGLSDRVRVIRGRAEDATTVAIAGSADLVTARAVAPLARLVRWCLPLLRPGGHLLAMKGASVREEVDRDAESIRASGADDIEIRRVGATLDEPTWVVLVRRGRVRKGQR